MILGMIILYIQIIINNIKGATLAHEANFSLSVKVSFMFFPLSVHCLDIFASTIGNSIYIIYICITIIFDKESIL